VTEVSVPPFPALLRLSWQQFVYYRSRYLIMGLLMVLGSGFLFISLAYLHSIQQSLEQGIITRLAGHLQLYAPGVKEVSLLEDPTGQVPWIRDPLPLEKGLTGITGLLGSTRRILTGGLIQRGGRSMGVLIAGMEMEKEQALRRRLAPHLPVETTPLNDREVLVGKGVARVLGLKPGDRVPVLVPNESGLISGRRFLVREVFPTPGLDPLAELFIYVNLTDLQSLLGLDQEIGHLVLFLAPGNSPAEIAGRITRTFRERNLPLQLFTWEQIGRPFLGILSLSRIFLGLTNLLILIVVFLSVANSTLMTLFNRTPELGTLLALGTRRTVLFGILWGELLLLGLITLAVGLALGWAFIMILGHWGLPALNPAMAMAFGQERLYFSTDGWTWFLAFSLSLITLFLASGWPLWRTCRMRPALVLKER
jgi:putative ABC transport system permease protein